MEISPGTIIHNKYQIKDKIGEGTSSIVYKAQDIDMDKPMALKFLREEFAQLPSKRKYFLKEAKIAARFIHEAVVPVRAVGEWENSLYIAMDFHPGRTLRDVLKERKLTLSEIRSISVQLLSCLAEAHKQDLLHRDIKPANLMVKEENDRLVLNILDFGIASSSWDENDGKTSGTPNYMSPEQLLGENIDHRSDLYSAAVCIYQMLTSKLPFDAANIEERAYRVLEKDPPPPSRFRRIPSGLDSVISRALALDRDSRYQSAEELKIAIENAFSSGYHFAWMRLAFAVSAVLLFFFVSLFVYGYQRHIHSKSLIQEAKELIQEKRWKDAREAAQKALVDEREEGIELIAMTLWEEFCLLVDKKQEQEMDSFLKLPVWNEPELKVFQEYLQFYHANYMFYQICESRDYEKASYIGKELAGMPVLWMLLNSQLKRVQSRASWEKLYYRIKQGTTAEASDLLAQAETTLSPSQIQTLRAELREKKYLEAYQQAKNDKNYLECIKIVTPLSSSPEWQKRLEEAQRAFQEEISQIKVEFPSPKAILDSRIITVKGKFAQTEYIQGFKVNGMPVSIQGNEWSARIAIPEENSEIEITYESNSSRWTISKIPVYVDISSPQLTVQSVRLDTIRGIVTISGNVDDNLGIHTLQCGSQMIQMDKDSKSWVYEIPMNHAPDSLLFSAIDHAGHKTEITAIIQKDGEPPVITVVSPENDAIIYSSEVTVKGKISDPSGIAFVKVSGVSATLTRDESKNEILWQALVLLNKKDMENGKCKLTIEAEDHWGNKSKAELFIIPQYFVWSSIKIIEELRLHQGKIWGLCYSPCSRYVVEASNDGKISVLYAPGWEVIDAREGKFITSHHLSVTPAIRCISDFLEKNTSKQKKDYWNQSQVAGIWSINVSELLDYGIDWASDYLDLQARHLAFADDYKKMAIGYRGGFIQLVLKTPSLRTQRFKAHNGDVTAIAFSPDGKILASGGGDGILNIWDMEGHLIHSCKSHTMTVTAVAFYKDGMMLASGSHDKTLCLWSTSDGTLICKKTGHTASIMSLTFSPDGKYLITGNSSGTLTVLASMEL